MLISGWNVGVSLSFALQLFRPDHVASCGGHYICSWRTQAPPAEVNFKKGSVKVSNQHFTSTGLCRNTLIKIPFSSHQSIIVGQL